MWVKSCENVISENKTVKQHKNSSGILGCQTIFRAHNKIHIQI